MRSVLLVSMVLWLCVSAVAEENSEVVGRELGEMFNAAALTVEVPAPKPKPAVPTVKQGEPAGGRELSVLAYSYCLRGRTASGRYTQHGTIAVDPRVIPLGSRIYVPGYGWGIAADTGGMIIGNKIDLWKPTARDCYSWGVRRVKIKVFPPGR